MAPARASHRVKRPLATTDAELSAAGPLDAASDYSDPALAAVDQSLRCPICTEFFSAPVLLTTCSHSFDSRCLREYIVVHKRCPSCLKGCDEGNIRLNLALQGAVAAWKDARRVSTLAAAARDDHAPSPPSELTAASRKSAGMQSAKRKTASLSSSSPTVKSEPRERGDTPVLVDDGSSDVEIVEDRTAASLRSQRPPPRKKARRSASRQNGGSAELHNADPTDPSLILECPLCGGAIRNVYMAVHVERCNGVPPPPTANSSVAWGKLLGAGGRAAGRDGDSDSSQSASREGNRLDTTRPLPLANYAHKSIAELNEMLKAYHLPTSLPATASRDGPLSADTKHALLVRRHRQFLVLWNANADLAPDDPQHKSAQGVRDELKRWERARDNESASGSAANGASSITQGALGEWSAKAHSKKYAADFKELIAQARASAMAARRARSSPVRTELPEPESQGPRTDEHNTALGTAAPTDECPTAETPSNTRRSRTVRILSPHPRRSPSRGRPASPSSSSSASASPSSPPLPLPRIEESPSSPSRSHRMGLRAETSRSPSPFDAERPPRASQRNREEERMFAELTAAREQDKVESDGSSPELDAGGEQ